MLSGANGRRLLVKATVASQFHPYTCIRGLLLLMLCGEWYNYKLTTLAVQLLRLLLLLAAIIPMPAAAFLGRR